jgi:hypothetical protein
MPGQLVEGGDVHHEEEQDDEHRQDHGSRVAGHGAQDRPAMEVR